MNGENKYTSNFNLAVKGVLYLTLSISLVVILGWILGITEVLSIIPQAPTMKFNTALLFALSSVSYLTNSEKLSKLLQIAVICLAGITLLEYITQTNLFIDNLLIKDRLTSADQLPGRMSIATAGCFLLINLQEITKNNSNKWTLNIRESMLLVVLFLSVLAIINYLLSIPTSHRISFISTMAIHTACLFLGFTFVLIKKHSELGTHQLLFGNNAGSGLMRKLLPLIITLPIILSLLILHFSAKGEINTDFGLALHTAIFVFISAIYITFVCLRYNTIDSEHQRLNKDIGKVNSELNQFQFALNESSIVAITDRNGIIRHVNDRFCEISGHNQEELIGKTHKIINSGHHKKAFFQDLWQTINKGQVWKGDIKNKTKQGTFYWVLTVIIPFRDDEGNIYQFLSIRQDISKRKQVEETLTAQNRHLERQNREIEQFAYITSHDLQEPLRTLINFTNLFEKRLSGELNDEGKKYLGFINQAATRMSSLITALLDYSRVGKSQDLTEVDNNQVIDQIIQDFNKKIEETQAKINVQPDLPKVYASQTSMRVLWQNLIANALKFTIQGITPVININAKEKKELIEFTVQDNGIGIPEEAEQKIFQIFQRLHPTKKYEGHGLGLALCKKIIDELDGELWISRPEKGGAKFHFTLKNHL